VADGKVLAGLAGRILAGLVLTLAFVGVVADVAPHSAGLPRLARYAAAHPGTVVYVTQESPTRVDVRWREGFAREERYEYRVALTNGAAVESAERHVSAVVGGGVRFDEADPAFGLGGFGSLLVVSYFRFVPYLWLRFVAWGVCFGILSAIAFSSYPGKGGRRGWYVACLLFGAGFWGYLLAARTRPPTGGAVVQHTVIAAVGLAALAGMVLAILNA